MRLRFLMAVLGLLVVMLTGCRVDSNVELNVDTDGGGDVVAEVRLDEEAAQAIGDVERQLRVQDLKDAGWQITGPREDGDETVVAATHTFDNSTEANALVRQLGGDGETFRDFQIRQQRSLTSVESGFTGTVDLSQGVTSWGTSELQNRTGSPLGIDPNEIQRNLGVNLEEAFTLSVKVNMPGESVSASPQLNDDGEWVIPYYQVSELAAESKGTNWDSVSLLVLAVALLGGAIALGTLWQTYKPKHRVPKEENPPSG